MIVQVRRLGRSLSSLDCRIPFLRIYGRHHHGNVRYLCVRNLVDFDKSGKLDSGKFSAAMFLIQKKLAGIPLPSSLPPGLISMQKNMSTMSFMSTGRFE